MEVSSDVLDGLYILGDLAQIPDKHFSVFVQRTFACLVKPGNDHDLTGGELSEVEAGCIKQAHTALVTLILEAAKQDKDTTVLSHILEDCKLTSDRVTFLEKAYTEHKGQIRQVLSQTGKGFPHIVDVKWRLDFYLKNNHLEKVKQPSYIIQLKTQEPGVPGIKDVEFSCSQDELQDLVGKLKEACKSLERVSQM